MEGMGVAPTDVAGFSTPAVASAVAIPQAGLSACFAAALPFVDEVVIDPFPGGGFCCLPEGPAALFLPMCGVHQTGIARRV